ncbi:Uncharacterised protein [Serratia fonticola]|nr:Uncharacterised protein [Serratia fonticola]
MQHNNNRMNAINTKYKHPDEKLNNTHLQQPNGTLSREASYSGSMRE